MSLISQIKLIKDKISGQILFDEHLAKYSWFNLGGPAKAIFKPKNLNGLSVFLKISLILFFDPDLIDFVPLPRPFKILVIPPIGIACTLIVSKNTKNKDRHRSIKYDLVLTIRNIMLHELY